MSQLIDKAKGFVAEKIANVKKPEASVTDVDFKRVSRDCIEYLANVSVTNPYGAPIPICEISYSLKSATRSRFDSIFQLKREIRRWLNPDGLILCCWLICVGR